MKLFEKFILSKVERVNTCGVTTRKFEVNDSFHDESRIPEINNLTTYEKLLLHVHVHPISPET